MQIEWGKLLVILTVVIGAVTCLITKVMHESAGVGIITACLGYTFGNGRLASRGKEPVPMIGRRGPQGPR